MYQNLFEHIYNSLYDANVVYTGASCSKLGYGLKLYSLYKVLCFHTPVSNFKTSETKTTIDRHKTSEEILLNF